jgi:hypothetical protein
VRDANAVLVDRLLVRRSERIAVVEPVEVALVDEAGVGQLGVQQLRVADVLVAGIAGVALVLVDAGRA